MKTGDSIFIKATVLRVEGTRLDAQTANGQLIQTDVSNVMTEENQVFVGVDFARPQSSETVTHKKPKTAEKKSDTRFEHKAELDAPENKSSNSNKHRGR